MKTPISFRLRKDMDVDLIQAVSELEQGRLAELCRNGLRLMLGIRTSRQAQVVEQLIVPVPISVKGVSAKIGSTNKPFMTTKGERSL